MYVVVSHLYCRPTRTTAATDSPWRAVPNLSRPATVRPRRPFRLGFPPWTLSSPPVVRRRIRRHCSHCRRCRCCYRRRSRRRPSSGPTSRIPTIAPSCSYRGIFSDARWPRQCRSVGHRSLALVFHFVWHRYMYTIGIVTNTGAATQDGNRPGRRRRKNIKCNYFILSKRTRRRRTIILMWFCRVECTARRRNGLRRRNAKGCDGRIYLFILFFSALGGRTKKKWKWIIWFADGEKKTTITP